MTDQLLEINGVELCVETFGDRTGPAILLVAGGSASMLWWDTELCQRIAAAGRHVIRYDHRDTGRSTSYPPGEPKYSYTDLALDVLGIQDALGIERAHLVCQSMFGGIGLIAGVDHPDRVASLIFVSSSTDEPGLPPPNYAIESDRRRGFGDITAPTLVVHGNHDPFLPLPHGEALRDVIPGAERLVLAGAGHDLPRPVWDVLVPALLRHTS